MLSNYVKKIQNFFFPSHCILCNAHTGRHIDLCNECEKDLPWVINACKQCGETLSHLTDNDLLCGKCVNQSSIIKHVFPLFEYKPPLDHLISAAKFHGKLAYCHLFGQLMAKRVREVWYKEQKLPNILIAMPLHKKRLRERGYNQALEIAKPVAKQLTIPIDIQCCKRSKATVPQMELPAKDRYRNVNDAFITSISLSSKHVAIIDDVVTTGQTVMELAKCLKRAGVERIDVWCCARTNTMNY